MARAHDNPDDRAVGALEDSLRRGLPAVGLAADDGTVRRLAQFIRLMAKWNQAYNLTSVRDPAEMVTRHVFDSLVARPWLHGNRILDVGSGAGLPGIPLAIVEPEKDFTLLDSGIKKVRFMRQAIAELGLANAHAEHTRVESYAPAQLFDTVMCRAFSSLADFARPVRRLLSPSGRLLALKGRYPADEISALGPTWEVLQVAALSVPGLVGARHAVVLKPRSDA